MEPINLERSNRYARAVQSTTTEKHETSILGYMGYVMSKFNVSEDSISLSAYAEADKFVHFISYLKARGVQKGQLLKSVSLARKVNDYLQSGTPLGSSTRDLAERMDRWLANLEAQVSASMPAPPSKVLPDAPQVFSWIDTLVDMALQEVESDVLAHGTITAKTAWSVQRALIAALVTGRYIPPCRLHWLKTLNHPKYNGLTACSDPDCRLNVCAGNHIELVRRTDVLQEEQVCTIQYQSWVHVQ